MSRERDRALATLADVSGIKATSETARKRYATLVYKLPVLLRTAGLAQTVAFLTSRSHEEGMPLVRHLGARLGLGQNVFAEIAAAPTGRYLALTAEALASADWYVRHVQAVLKVERTDTTGDD